MSTIKNLNKDNLSIMTIFPTKVLNYVWQDVDELNKELKNVIFEKEKQTDGLKHSNVGGFHSTIDLFDWDYPCIKTLHGMINNLIGYMANNYGVDEGVEIKLSMAGWANIVRNSNYSVIHNHPNNFWSGVYYLDGGDPDEDIPQNGLFEFVDPRAGSNMVSTNNIKPLRYQVKPNPGLMIMFPSFVDHYVHPFIGSRERITIAFNIQVV